MINQESIGKKLPTYAEVLYEVLNFSGGLNTRASQFFMSRDNLFSLKPDQFTLGINLIRTKSGMLTTRPGRVKVNSTPVTPASGDAVIRSMYELRRNDGVNRVCMNAGNTFYYLDGSTWTTVGTFATANLRRCYTQFKDVLLGVDGTNDMMKYDGTTLSAIAAAPKGLAMASHRSRVWIVKDRTLSYCALGDETDWTTVNNAGSVPVPTSKGTGGTAMIALWDRLIVFCGEQVFQLSGTGPSDFKLTPVNMTYGNSMSCYGPIAAGNDIYFGDTRGLHGLSVTEAQNLLGDVSYNYISGKVEPDWHEVAESNLPNTFSLHDKQNNLALFFFSKTASTNDTALAADYYHLDERGHPTWTMYSNMPFACGVEVTSIMGANELLFGGYDGIVYKQTDASLDDTTNIPVSFQYLTDCELPQFSKLLRHLLFFTDAQSGTVNVSVNFDFGRGIVSKSFDASSGGADVLGSSFVLGTSALGTAAFKQTRVSVPGHGRFMRVNVSYSGPSRFSLGGFIMFAGARRLLSF